MLRRWKIKIQPFPWWVLIYELECFQLLSASYLSSSPGPMVDETTGKVVAQHNGIWNFTIGECARISGLSEKMFVSGKNLATNTIHVVPGTDNPILNCMTLHVPEFYWIWKDSPPAELDSMSGFRANVKHRYRMEHEACTVYRCVSLLPIENSLTKCMGKQTSQQRSDQNRSWQTQQICVPRPGRYPVHWFLVLRLRYHRADIIIYICRWFTPVALPTRYNIMNLTTFVRHQRDLGFNVCLGMC